MSTFLSAVMPKVVFIMTVGDALEKKKADTKDFILEAA